MQQQQPGYPPQQYPQPPYGGMPPQYPQQPGYPAQPMYQPPPKKGMTAGKVVLIVIGVIFMMAFASCAVCSLAVGGAASAVADKQQQREAQEQAVEAAFQDELEKCKASRAVEWKDIKAMLKENEAKVASMWKGSCVKVSGVVERIDSGFDDRPYVVIGDGTDFSLNNLHCKPVDEKKALDLSTGAEITVWGRGEGEVIGSLTMSHCDW